MEAIMSFDTSHSLMEVALRPVMSSLCCFWYHDFERFSCRVETSFSFELATDFVSWDYSTASSAHLFVVSTSLLEPAAASPKGFCQGSTAANQ